MKISDLEPGTRILIPCVRCGTKRSIVFRSYGEYMAVKARICAPCRHDDIAEDNNLYMTRQHTKSPAYKDYE